MDDGATGTSTAQDLMVYRADPSHLVNTDELLQQGLALADELDRLMESESAARDSLSTFSSSNLEMDAPFSLFQEENTVLQLESKPKAVRVSSLRSAKASAKANAKTKTTEPGNAWARVWLQRGLSKLKQGNFQGARDNFERALEKSPRSVSALNGLGIAQYRLASFVDSIHAFRQAIDLAPAAAGNYSNLGAVLYQMGDFSNAVAMFQKAARLAPREVHAYYGLGVSLMQEQQYSQAIAAFRRGVALDDQHAACYYGMGYVNYLLGELPAAIAALGKAKQRNPQYARRYEAFLKHCLEQDELSAKN
jgi:Flp pilus assembly protein TadD